MNRWFILFCRKIIVFIVYKRGRNLIKNGFKFNEKMVEFIKKNIFLNIEELSKFFIYKDELWNFVKNIYELMWNDLFKNKFF